MKLSLILFSLFILLAVQCVKGDNPIPEIPEMKASKKVTAELIGGNFSTTPQNLLASGGKNVINLSWELGNEPCIINLSWDKVDDANKYSIYRAFSDIDSDKPKDKDYQFHVFSKNNKYTDELINDEGIYYYRIYTHWDAEHVSEDYAEVNATFIKETDSNTSYKYNVYRSRTKDGRYFLINSTSTRSTYFTDKNIPADSTYYYKIQTVLGRDSYSEFSNIASATTFEAHHNEANVTFNKLVLNGHMLTLQVNVYDENGDVITGLGVENFQALEDNNPINVISVTNISNTQPISASCTMDYSGSMADSDIMQMQLLINGMVQSKMNDDEFNIVKFSSNVDPQSGFSNDINAISQDIFNTYSDAGGSTALYDAIKSSLDSVKTRQDTNRKLVIAFTDGGDNNSTSSIDDIVTYAQQLAIPVYTVAYGSAYSGSIPTDLKYIADNTGGTVVQGDIDSTGLYELIATQLENTYLVTVEVLNITGIHKITLNITAGSLTDSITIPVYYDAVFGGDDRI